MIHFRTAGVLPATCEDFFSNDASRYPHITIVTKSDLADNGYALDDVTAAADDGWLDIVVDTSIIDLDVARLAIAEALGIDNPEDVVIEVRGLCRNF